MKGVEEVDYNFRDHSLSVCLVRNNFLEEINKFLYDEENFFFGDTYL